MRRALSEKNKFTFVNGSIPVLEEFDPSFKAWNHCKILVHMWILNPVEEFVVQSKVLLENSIDVWNELRERFSQGGFIRISELQCEIFALKQDSQSVSDFFISLKVLREELETYFPILVCIVVYVTQAWVFLSFVMKLHVPFIFSLDWTTLLIWFVLTSCW